MTKEDILCSCNEVYVGSEPTGSKNIAEDCQLHGVGTEYMKNYLEKANARLRELYKLRDEARKNR